jgi:hypothetical protein
VIVEFIKKYSILLLVSLFIGWGVSSELILSDVHFSDGAFHLSVLKYLDSAVKNNLNPLDFWYSGTPFGFALFRSYQYLPYLIIYSIYRVTFEFFSLSEVFTFCTIVLCMLIPWSTYFSLKKIGLSNVACTTAAIMSVLVADGGEFGFGLQNYLFGTNGLYTQLWAMVFLPLAISASYLYINNKTNFALSILFGFLTFGSHVVAAFILFFSVGVFWLLNIIRNKKFNFQIFNYFSVLALVTAHQWFFAFKDSLYINQSSLEPAWKYNGRGFEYVVKLFWDGSLFDTQRFPSLTILFLIGLSAYLFYPLKENKNKFYADSFYALLLFLSLYIGRQIWGFLFENVGPLSSIHIHRFVIGVHFYSFVIIGLAAETIFKFTQNNQNLKKILLVIFLAILLPAFNERFDRFEHAKNLRIQSKEFFSQSNFVNELVEITKKINLGPIYAGATHNWDYQTRQFGIPIHFFFTASGLPTVGGALYHAFSLAGETLFDINVSKKSHFELYGIGSIASTNTWAPLDKYNLLETKGNLSLYKTNNGILRVGQLGFISCGEKIKASDFMRRWVSSDLVDYSIYGIVAPENCEKNISTLEKVNFVQNPPNISKYNKSIIGEVIEYKNFNTWAFSGKVKLNSPGIVVAATGYHPNWKVKVNGEEKNTLWVTPGFIAVEVPAGIYDIDFEYQGSQSKAFLLIASFFILFALFKFTPRNFN